jgi:23S rRNA (pseudouridine1915-N3)-methyltransferase
LSHYIQLEWKVIPEQKIWKKLGAEARKKAEGAAILEQITPGDKVILLDENGKSPGSEAFAHQLEKIMASGTRRLILVIGGAFGFSSEVYAEVPDRLSLSKYTKALLMPRVLKPGVL